MKSFAITLFCLLATSMAMADAPNTTVLAPAVSYPYMRFKPPLDKIFARAVRYGHSVSTSVNVTYDRDGNVLAVKLDKTTGDKSLDKAILDWAALAKIQADGAGSGALPIKIRIGR
jgi:outer membrane biosynthesis protein TonB